MDTTLLKGTATFLCPHSRRALLGVLQDEGRETAEVSGIASVPAEEPG